MTYIWPLTWMSLIDRQWDSPDTISCDSIHQLQPISSTSNTLEAPSSHTTVAPSSCWKATLIGFLRDRTPTKQQDQTVSPSVLRHCADQLSPDIFNTLLETCHVPACFKTSTIIPIPRMPRTTGLNDYSPVALTFVVMKLFEHLVLSHIKAIHHGPTSKSSIMDPLLDPLQFAYKANRSVDDAVNMNLHFILQHLCQEDKLLSWVCLTVEMIVDYRKNPAAPAPTIILCDFPFDTAEFLCFLGTIITRDTKWDLNIRLDNVHVHIRKWSLNFNKNTGCYLMIKCFSQRLLENRAQAI